jgi:quercetin dioxygenase-like cupin family protein
VLLSVVVVVLLGIVASWRPPIALAQEATPAAEEMEGITFEPLSFALGIDVASPLNLFVVRIGIEPGTVLPNDAKDPSLGIVVVESGTLTVQLDAPVSVTRGAGLGEALEAAEATGDFSTLMEAITPGEAVTLEAGDAAYLPANSGGEIRNDGQEPVVALGFLVVPPGGMMAEATPAP